MDKVKELRLNKKIIEDEIQSFVKLQIDNFKERTGLQIKSIEFDILLNETIGHNYGQYNLNKVRIEVYI